MIILAAVVLEACSKHIQLGSYEVGLVLVV
jgi:hypothetical protein